jgi:drug/metabolite transporter (DMT)-like permease
LSHSREASPARTSATTSAPSSTATVLLVALLCLVWGSTWIVIKWGLRDLPPFTAGSARFIVAAIVMTAIAPILARREGGRSPPLSLSLVVGLLNFGASYGIVYWSETRIPSGLTSVLWSVYPLMMAVAGAWFLAGERVRARQLVGFLLGFAGVAVLFATDLRDLGTETVKSGMVLLVSPLVSCVGTTIAKRAGKDVSSALMNRNAMWIGAGVLVACAIGFERGADPHWSARAIGSVAYLAVLGTVVTFTLYFWLLRHVAAYRLAMISYITPVIALTLGTLAGNEALTTWTIAGSVTILVGVALVVVRPRAREVVREQPPAVMPAAERWR